jgi:hypothetical protein
MAQDKTKDATFPIVYIPPVNIQTADEERRKRSLPLNGKLITSEDPITIGQNFRTYKNMRPTSNHPRAIGGMSKINSNVIDSTYLKTRSAFHFIKSQPEETHVIAQVFNSGLTGAIIYDNSTAIGSTGNFTSDSPLLEYTATPGYGRFSNAPGGQMAYCDNKNTCLWGGDEISVGAFITSSADITDSGVATDPKDYTNVINNNRSDGANTASIGGGIDTATVLLLHGEGANGSTTFTDSSSDGKSVTQGGTAQISTAQYKFGAASIYFNGSGDYLTTADHADFYMSTGDFTIDFWVRFSSLGAGQIIFSQYVDTNNYAAFWYAGPDLHQIGFTIKSSSTETVSVTASNAITIENRWYHVALIKGPWGGTANTWVITVDGVLRSALPHTDTDPWPDFAAPFEIGREYISLGYLAGWIDEFRVSKGIARWTTDFTVPSRQYADQSLYWIIGSPRPLDGLKYYIDLANAETSVMSGKYWSGNTWTTLSMTDGTSSGGKTLAQTGSVTFSSTVSTARPRLFEGYFLYWYVFSLSAGYSEIYRITLSAPFQQIVDIWDGIERKIAIAYLYKSAYIDYTLNLYTEEYDSTDAATFVELDSLAITEYLLLGFFERTCAINILTAPGSTNAGGTNPTTLTVSYWDGNDWVSVGNVNDGTVDGGISLAKPGFVSWTPPLPEQEFTKAISNGIPLYYYKLSWSEALDADVQIYYTSSVPAQATIDNYKFPLYTQNRLLLCNNVDSKKNTILYSSADTAQVFNGDDSGRLEFGDDSELTCGCSLFAQFGSNMYNLSILFKESEMWTLTMQDENWIRYKISNSIGCPAPLSLCTTISTPNEELKNLNRYIAIWQANNGIYLSDGRAPLLISKDIEDVFNQTSSTCINRSYIDKSVGFLDETNQEYHWLYCSGTPVDATSPLNKELVFSFKEWKWYEVDRTTGKYLQFGLSVHDTYGNALNYGFIDTGYMEALEFLNSTAGIIKTFDGTDITCTIETGDFPLEEGNLLLDTQLIGSMLVSMSKATTTNNITLSHYIDTGSTAVTTSFDPTNTGYRASFQFKEESSIPGIFHSFKLVMIANNETIAFEPLIMIIVYHIVREHDYDKNW